MLILTEILPSAAFAKPVLRDPVAEVVRPCPEARPGEIAVCARNSSESPYRLPLQFRDEGFRIDGPDDSVSRERHRITDVGGAGAQQNACSPVGQAGWTQCDVKAWREADQQRGFRPPQ